MRESPNSQNESRKLTIEADTQPANTSLLGLRIARIWFKLKKKKEREIQTVDRLVSDIKRVFKQKQRWTTLTAATQNVLSPTSENSILKNDFVKPYKKYKTQISSHNDRQRLKKKKGIFSQYLRNWAHGSESFHLFQAGSDLLRGKRVRYRVTEKRRLRP